MFIHCKNKIVFLIVFSILPIACELANEPVEEEIDYPFDYISFEADGEKVFLSYPRGNPEYQIETGYKDVHYAFSNSIELDAARISINDSTVSMRAYLSILNANLFSKSYPFTFDQSIDFREEGRVTLGFYTDLTTAVDTINGFNDHVNHFGNTWNEELSVTITSFENMQIKGRFEGYVDTRSGSSVIEIRNGRFKADLELITKRDGE